MRPFSINIRGRVKNFNLPKNQPLVPLFEAVVNAIHAIDERKSADTSFEGRIVVKILRNFFSILKTECIYRHQPASFDEAIELIDNYIYFYNHQRIQLKTGVAPLTLRHSL